MYYHFSLPEITAILDLSISFLSLSLINLLLVLKIWVASTNLLTLGKDSLDEENISWTSRVIFCLQLPLEITAASFGEISGQGHNWILGNTGPTKTGHLAVTNDWPGSGYLTKIWSERLGCFAFCAYQFIYLYVFIYKQTYLLLTVYSCGLTHFLEPLQLGGSCFQFLPMCRECRRCMLLLGGRLKSKE